MPRTTSTHFEQIPVEVVKKIAIRQTDKNAKVSAGTLIRKPASQQPQRDPARRRRLANSRRLRRLAMNRHHVETL
jgi:hypothetical protein